MKEQKYIPALTSIRFFWALTILVGHFVVVYKEYIKTDSWVNRLNFGNFGVSCFFVSSGFLIALHYSDGTRINNLKNSIKYAINSVKKTYVLYVISFIPWLFYQIMDTKTVKGWFDLVIRILANLTLTQSWLPFREYSINNVTWFLSTLFFLYIISSYLIQFTRSLVNTTIKKITVLIISIIAIGIIDYFWGELGQLYHHFLLRVFQFYIGIVLSELIITFSHSVNRIYVILGCAIHVFVYIYCHSIVAATLSAMLIIWLLYGVERNSLFNNSMLVYLGGLSTGIYFIHNPILSFGKHFMVKILIPTNNGRLIIHFLVVLTSSILFALIYDKLTKIKRVKREDI